MIKIAKLIILLNMAIEGRSQADEGEGNSRGVQNFFFWMNG